MEDRRHSTETYRAPAVEVTAYVPEEGFAVSSTLGGTEGVKTTQLGEQKWTSDWAAGHMGTTEGSETYSTDNGFSMGGGN